MVTHARRFAPLVAIANVETYDFLGHIGVNGNSKEDPDDDEARQEAAASKKEKSPVTGSPHLAHLIHRMPGIRWRA